MPEYEFRAYHLGQPVDSAGVWLPHKAWDDCVHSDPPRDGAHVVLAVWGNYRRQIAVVGCGLDGSVFFGWMGEKPTDVELENVIRRACEQWEVEEIVHKQHIRINLMERLLEDGLPVEAWPSDHATEKDSTAALYQALMEGEIVHDHAELIAEQMRRLTAQVDRQGNPRLVESEDDVSAALAVRAAWWRARALTESDTEELVIW